VQLHRERRRHLQHQQQREQEQPTEAPSNSPHLLFNGNLKNDLGEPVEDAQIQFWHADFHGNYFHPGDDLEGKELMKDSFSYFGTATTDAMGDFDFKSYRPGIYAGRPVTHIHFKVFHDGQELLTSQFYFEDENVGQWYDEMVILKLEEGVDDEDGSVFLSTTKQVVVNMRMGGLTKLTPRDVEGPFYPLVDFFDVGNDMTSGLLSKYASEAPITTAVDSSPTSTPTRFVSFFVCLCSIALVLLDP
jgi:protocatechuate 3,4-dioxygenase beta subunit